MPSEEEASCVTKLERNHPAHAYLDDAKALLNLIRSDPSMLNCDELKFLKKFIQGSDCDESSDDSSTESNKYLIGESEISQNSEGYSSLDVSNENKQENFEKFENLLPWFLPNEVDYSIEFTVKEDLLGRDHVFDCVIIGAGASGIGVAVSLLAGGMKRSNLVVLEAEEVGFSFAQWPPFTRFISPSMHSNPFGSIDLNAVDPWSSPAAILNGEQHPTGLQYQHYLREVATKWRLPIWEQTRVLKVEPAAPQSNHTHPEIPSYQLFDVHIQPRLSESIDTLKDVVIRSRFVVWCGGEWGSAVSSDAGVQSSLTNANMDSLDDTSFHYSLLGCKEEDWLTFTKDQQHIVIVGGFESGVDVACALISRYKVRHVTIIEKAKHIHGWPNHTENVQNNLDPSVCLSSNSRIRLAQSVEEGKITIMSGTSFIKCQKDKVSSNKYLVYFKNLDSHEIVDPINASAPVLLCTGFNPSESCKTILSNLLDWRDRDHSQSPGVMKSGPIVSQSCDESENCHGVFCAGPMIRHYMSTKHPDFKIECIPNMISSSSGLSKINTSQYAELVFCFIYKFRTRFAVVSGEILSRLVQKNHCKTLQNGSLVIDSKGHACLSQIERMLEHYRQKGFMLTDLICAIDTCTAFSC